MQTSAAPRLPATAPVPGLGQVMVPADTADYWLDTLLRIGVQPVADLAADTPYVAFVPPDSRVADGELRALQARGVALVGDGRIHQPFTGRPSTAHRLLGVQGRGPLFAGCPTIRMPAVVQVADRRLLSVALDTEAPRIALPLPTAAAALAAPPAMYDFGEPGGGGLDEIVSGCDHGGLRRLLGNALQLACRRGDRPFAHLGNAPDGYSGVLALRIDADDFDPRATDAVLDALERAGLRATWFIDVERHQRNGGAAAVQRIAAAGHEVQSHFFHHYTYRSATRNRANLRRSRAVLATWGIEATAAATPFGAFHAGVQAALAAEGIAWSSEFSAHHDDEPSRITGRVQVPVHPVCPILLLQAGHSAAAVQDYYTGLLRERLANGDSALFYGHPIRDLEAVPDLLPALRREIDQYAAANGDPVWQPTLGEFKQFHDQRRKQLQHDGPVRAASKTAPTGLMPTTDILDACCSPWRPPAGRRLRRKQHGIRFRRWLREVRRR